jgi:class 3 adenylate cyclase
VIMVVVVGTTLLTLTLTHNKVAAAYRASLQNQFQTEMNFFFEKQATRLTTVKQNCLQLASSVRLQAALESDIETPHLYKIAMDELRTVLNQSEDSSSSPSDNEKATFFRILDSKGQILDTDLSNVGLNQGEAKSNLYEKLSRLGPLLVQSDKKQQVGYLVVHSERDLLNEVIVTKMVDPESNQIRGALVIGFPATQVSSQSKGAHESTHGIWIENQLYSTSHALLSPLLIPYLQQMIITGKKSQDDFPWAQDSQQYHIFFKALNSDSQFSPAFRIGIYSLGELEQQQKEWTRQILSFGMLGLIGGALLGFLFAHNLSEPIHRLVAGTRQIQKGNFDIEIPVRSSDEIGKLTSAFNSMAKDLALKDKYRSVLDMVADPKVAEELLHGNVPLGGEIRDVSVLFCDIRGFTPLTENMKPSQVIDMLNEHMSSLTKVVYDDQGVVDKFVGDLIMALFGAPKSYGNDTLHAVHCALKMLETRNALNQVSKYKIEVGIGIASGQVIAGRMGASDRNNYTVLGERVNLASRLCSNAGRGEIIIDEETHNRIKDLAITESVSKLKLKGYAEPVEAFKVIGLRDKNPG